MEFLVMVVVLGVQLKLEPGYSLAVERYFFRAFSPVDRAVVSSHLLLILFGYILTVALIFWLFKDVLWGVVYYGLSAVVLLGLMGEAGYRQRLESYQEAWRRGDFSAAGYQAERLELAGAKVADAPPSLQMADVCRATLYQFFVRYFSILFWFVLVGPVFALFTRLVFLGQQVVTQRDRGAWRSANRILEWLPARVLALSFALAGNLVDCLRACRDIFFDPAANTRALLDQAAEGALDNYNPSLMAKAKQDPLQVVAVGLNGLSAVRGLINRTLGIWLGALAIMAIFSVA